MIDKKRLFSVSIIVCICFLIVIFLMLQKYNDFPFKSRIDWINAEERAKSIDKKKFIDYEIKENSMNSKELIAVVFNTDNETNLGFIDEYGNVIKEPFLRDNYDYYEKLRGPIGIKRYFENYYKHICLNENGDYYYTFYDRNFNPVTLSNDEQKKYETDKDEIKWIYDNENKINENDFKNLIAYLDEILKSDYSIYDIDYNENMYNIYFSFDFRGYNILLDKQLQIATRLYFPDSTTLNIFTPPSKDSKVGNFLIKDFGLVYYNTHGDIIWITYCKDR